MSSDFGARPPRPNRRLVLVVSALAAILLAAVGGVALLSGNSWRDEAISGGVLPDLPDSEWSATSEVPWWTSAPGASSTGSESGTPTAPSATVVPATAPATTSSIPTATAPAPSSTVAPRPTTAAPSTAAPSPTSPTDPRPRPKPSTPPAPTPSPTSSDGGCFLLVIC